MLCPSVCTSSNYQVHCKLLRLSSLHNSAGERWKEYECWVLFSICLLKTCGYLGSQRCWEVSPGWTARGSAVISVSCDYCFIASRGLPRVSLLKFLIHQSTSLQDSCLCHHTKSKKENFVSRPRIALDPVAVAWLPQPSDPFTTQRKGKGANIK